MAVASTTDMAEHDIINSSVIDSIVGVNMVQGGCCLHRLAMMMISIVHKPPLLSFFALVL